MFLSDYNANEVVAQVTEAVNSFQISETISIKMGGEQRRTKRNRSLFGHSNVNFYRINHHDSCRPI